MPDRHTEFTGSIPENYDAFLGPMFFEPYASDIAKRLKVPDRGSVLELACGTGILTRKLQEALPSTARLVATDLNDPMIDFAARKFKKSKRLEWKQVDATTLPFEDESFDVVVCQFGLMFVPDKVTAIRETYRILKRGGRFVFSVWDAIERNDFAYLAHRTITSFFENDPPMFYEVPFSFHDPKAIRPLCEATGFRKVKVTPLELPCVSSSAADAAKGLVQGNPVAVAINERNSSLVAKITGAVAQALAARFGDRLPRGKMRALIWEAVR